MKTISRLAVAAAIASLLAGCATKRYGRMISVSSLEASELDCREIKVEVSKVEGFLLEVEKGSQIDGRSVLGFLGDFGIGNAMEKNEAVKSARERLAELRDLEVQKGCK